MFGLLFVDADELQRWKEVCGIGCKHWFQNDMGNALIDEDIRMVAELKLKSSVLKITNFLRLRLALPKLRVATMKAARRTPQVFINEYTIHCLIYP